MKVLAFNTKSKSCYVCFILIIISLCFNYILGTLNFNYSGVMRKFVHLKNNKNINSCLLLVITGQFLKNWELIAMAKGIDYEIYLILRVHEDKNSKKKTLFQSKKWNCDLKQEQPQILMPIRNFNSLKFHKTFHNWKWTLRWGINEQIKKTTWYAAKI